MRLAFGIETPRAVVVDDRRDDINKQSHSEGYLSIYSLAIKCGQCDRVSADREQLED